MSSVINIALLISMVNSIYPATAYSLLKEETCEKWSPIISSPKGGNEDRSKVRGEERKRQRIKDDPWNEEGH